LYKTGLEAMAGRSARLQSIIDIFSTDATIVDIIYCEKIKAEGIFHLFFYPVRGRRQAAIQVQFTEPYQLATLIKRYRRFLADVRLENGKTLTVHCPNSGSMKGCSATGSPVVISRSANPDRKYAWTLEMVMTGNTWIGINTSRTNHLVQEAMENLIIDDFGAITSIRREVKVSGKSRLDFLLQADDGKVYIEVKNCSLVEGSAAMFPDAVTARGTRHLEELAKLADEGHTAALIFCVQREDADFFTPAAAIDPVYTAMLKKVQKKGVRVLCYLAEVQPGRVAIVRKIPVMLSAA